MKNYEYIIAGLPVVDSGSLTRLQTSSLPRFVNSWTPLTMLWWTF